jgi:hypothetical protein
MERGVSGIHATSPGFRFAAPGLRRYWGFKSQTAKLQGIETVIASKAKQSMVQQKERMDCFAALAMT